MGPAALVEQHVAAHLLGMGLTKPLRAKLAAGLLVHDGHDQQLAARGTPSFAREPRHGGDLGGDLGLHVERAAPPHEALGNLARPGVVRPLSPIREHRVDVAEITEGRVGGTFNLAFQSGHQVRALGSDAKQLTLKAGVGEDLPQVLDRGALVAGRVDRVEANQALKEPCCLVSRSIHPEDRTPLGKRGHAASSVCV